LFCRVFPGPALPWNPRKPILGVIAGLLASALPAAALAAWAFPGLSHAGWLALALLLAGAALVETLWFGVADNLTVPFAVTVALPLIGPPLFAPALAAAAGGSSAATGVDDFGGMGCPSPLALLVLILPIAFGAGAYATKKLTLGGAALGALSAF